jgi:hypothetical protein
MGKILLRIHIEYFLKQHQTVEFVLVMGCVLFDVRTEFLNIIERSFGFIRLITGCSALLTETSENCKCYFVIKNSFKLKQYMLIIIII